MPSVHETVFIITITQFKIAKYLGGNLLNMTHELIEKHAKGDFQSKIHISSFYTIRD